MLAQILGQHTDALERAAPMLRPVGVPLGPIVAGLTDGETNERRLGMTRRVGTHMF